MNRLIYFSRMMWETGRWLGHYGDHPRPRVADRGMPSRMDKRVAPDREGAADKQCQGEGKRWSQYVITNREKGKGKPPRLFPKTGYPLGYLEPALQQKTEERERHPYCLSVYCTLLSPKWCILEHVMSHTQKLLYDVNMERVHLHTEVHSLCDTTVQLGSFYKSL